MTDESKFPAVALGGGIKTLSEWCRIALHQSKQSSSMLINEHSSHPGLPEGFCLGKNPNNLLQSLHPPFWLPIPLLRHAQQSLIHFLFIVL